MSLVTRVNKAHPTADVSYTSCKDIWESLHMHDSTKQIIEYLQASCLK